MGQHAVLDMNYIVPAGTRLDLADGTLCLPDKVRIHLSGRRAIHGFQSHNVKLWQNECITTDK